MEDDDHVIRLFTVMGFNWHVHLGLAVWRGGNYVGVVWVCHKCVQLFCRLDEKGCALQMFPSADKFWRKIVCSCHAQLAQNKL